MIMINYLLIGLIYASLKHIVLKKGFKLFNRKDNIVMWIEQIMLWPIDVSSLIYLIIVFSKMK